MWPSSCAGLFEILSKHPPCRGSRVLATTRPFGSGGAEWNRVNGRAVGASIFVRVTKGLSLCHIAINVMKVWRNELKTSVNVINVTFYLG